MKVSLWNLVNRVKQDAEILELHPENRELLEKRIKENKELIVRCVMQNAREYNQHLDSVYIE